METVNERIARLDLENEFSGFANENDANKRRETLAIAHERGVDDAVFANLTRSSRVKRSEVIVLPVHHLETKSRGKGWCRKGRGSSAEWGERVDGGYQVGPGRWTVGGNDGFHRKGETTWDVEHVTVGNETWTVAN